MWSKQGDGPVLRKMEERAHKCIVLAIDNCLGARSPTIAQSNFGSAASAARPPRHGRTLPHNKMSHDIPLAVRALFLAGFPCHFPGCFSVHRLDSFTPRSDIASIRSISSRTYSSSAS
jgi:hypothetical protein